MFIADLIKRADLIPIIEDPSSPTPREERARDVWHADAVAWFSLWRDRVTNTANLWYRNTDLHIEVFPYIKLIALLPKGTALKSAVLELLSSMRSANLTDDAQVCLCSRILQTVRARLWGSDVNPGGGDVS